MTTPTAITMSPDAVAVDSNYYLCPSGATPSAHNELPVIYYNAEQPYDAQLEQIAERHRLILAIRRALSRARMLPDWSEWSELMSPVSFSSEVFRRYFAVLRNQSLHSDYSYRARL